MSNADMIMQRLCEAEKAADDLVAALESVRFHEIMRYPQRPMEDEDSIVKPAAFSHALDVQTLIRNAIKLHQNRQKAERA